MKFDCSIQFTKIVSRLRLLTFIAIVCTICIPLPTKAQKLRVGVAGSSPFVIKQGSTPEGISVEIWEELASLEELEYQLIPQQGVANSIDAVVRGELDIAIGPISITSDRLEKVTFTQPFFIADIGLLVAAAKPSLWKRIRPFFGLAFISSVGLFVVVLFTVGNLLWLAERQHNTQQFPKNYWHGVGNGIWFALVTLTTVGYGDRTPVTRMGRTIAGIWMIVTMVTVSSITAGIATTLTLSLSNQTSLTFSNPEDINGSRIAVVAGTTGEKWAQEYGARISQAQTLEAAINLLKLEQVDGVVFDTPALKYYLHLHPTENLRISPVSFANESYGFVLSQNISLQEDFNIRLLEMQENGKIREIQSKWFSD